jgi:hypothetical protein
MRLTSPAKRALAGGLAFGAVATGGALADSTRHGVGVGVAVLIALALAVGVIQFASRKARRT